MVPIAMSIAGSDPSGGAGIQADLKTFHQFGVYGQAVITLLTVQNTVSVEHVEVMPAELVVRQTQAVLRDMPPHAAKTGALGSAAVVEAVADLAASLGFPLVVDPVMLSKHGAPLMDEEARRVVLRKLIPRARLVTPNIHEASALTGIPIDTISDMERAARRLVELGAGAVLVKGGHLPGDAIDLLVDGDELHRFTGERFETAHTHGTGCTYSAAITAELAKGVSLCKAVERAKHFITEAIRTSPGLGRGSGPVNHHATLSTD